MPWHHCIALILVLRSWGSAEGTLFVPFPKNYSSVLRAQLTRKHNRTNGAHKIATKRLEGESDFHLVDDLKENVSDFKSNGTPHQDSSLAEKGDIPIPPIGRSYNDGKSSSRQAARQKDIEVPNKWNTSSFLGGIAVGVVSTLLLIGCFLDRRANRKPGMEKEPDGPFTKFMCWVLGNPPLGDPPPQRVQFQQNLDPEVSNPGTEERRNTEPNLNRPRALGEDPVEESLHLYWPRLGCLVLMLLIQSISSIILAGFQDLVVDQPSLIFFLTMIVGLGGNAGGQSAVLTVRRLALGQKSSILEQFNKGILLSLVMAPLAFARAIIQGTNIGVCFTISLAVFFITVLATTAGTALPRIFATVRIDPAHATPVIQVLMDITGIMIVCAWGVLIL